MRSSLAFLENALASFTDCKRRSAWPEIGIAGLCCTAALIALIVDAGFRDLPL
jgi:hypothetical protein